MTLHELGRAPECRVASCNLSICPESQLCCRCCFQAATCADADGANGSPNAYSCPPGYKPKSGVSSEVIQGLALTAQRDKCCERVRASSCSCNAAHTYIHLGHCLSAAGAVAAACCCPAAAALCMPADVHFVLFHTA